MADFQNRHFSKSPILKIFLPKFHRLVLGLVGLIDAKGIDVAQPIWSWGCLTLGKKWIFCVFRLFCPHVEQPHDHIGWATSMLVYFRVEVGSLEGGYFKNMYSKSFWTHSNTVFAHIYNSYITSYIHSLNVIWFWLPKLVLKSLSSEHAIFLDLYNSF